MLQITVTISAHKRNVMEELGKLEHEGIAKIIKQPPPALILEVPQQNEEKVISTLAKLGRDALVSDSHLKRSE